MSGTVFYKMTGSGNDFVFFDGRTEPVAAWSAEKIAAICHRRTGIGADGVVILEPGAEGSVRFHYFNSDGSRAAMCGNAALCATRLAVRLELAEADRICLETDVGHVRARCITDSADRAELFLPDVEEVRTTDLVPEDGERAIGFALVGVPHVVVLVDDLDAIDLVERGRALRSHPMVAPAGANANFVAGDGAGWAMRTYERGVEAETLACGTGAVAAAGVLALRGAVDLPLTIRTRSGEALSVSAEFDPGPAGGALRRVSLAGQGRLVYRGIL